MQNLMFILPYSFLTFLFSCSVLIISVYLSFCNITDKVQIFSSGESYLSYDFIVVGAGSAGSVVARRLAEHGKVSVLLLEAGGSSGRLMDMPFLAPLLQLSDFDWQYKTQPQSNACLGLQSKSSLWPRGKVLGGTSRLNFMMYLRGSPRDFDAWHDAGNPGWNYRSVLPYFKKSEHQTGRFKMDGVMHGSKGPLQVSDISWASHLADTFIKAGQWLGYETGDLNGDLYAGFMMTQFTAKSGQRHSSDAAFLDARSNLHILTHAQVEKILFRRSNEAYGVQFHHFGQFKIAVASKEIILSSGSIGSPHILMLSGIGARSHLQDHGIQVVADLPGVGQNLQDHITTGTDIVVLDSSKSEVVTLATFPTPSAILQYFWAGLGPLTSIGCEAFGVVHSGLVNKSTEPADLQVMFMPLGLSTDCGKFFRHAFGLSQQVWEKYLAPLCSQPVASLMPVLLRPHSRGEILLHSSNPKEHPLINPRYFSHPIDVERMVQGMRVVEALVSSPPFAELGARLNTTPMPGCEHFLFASDEYWSCYVRHLTLTVYHPVGTCHMGLRSREMSVVDHQLRVYKVRHLRVIDASIMPSIVGANINAATVMIAEKGSDMIRSYWTRRAMSCQVLDILLHSYQCPCAL